MPGPSFEGGWRAPQPATADKIGLGPAFRPHPIPTKTIGFEYMPTTGRVNVERSAVRLDRGGRDLLRHLRRAWHRRSSSLARVHELACGDRAQDRHRRR